MDATNSIIALGQACSVIQAMPNQIQSTAKELNISPVMRINMIDHYSEADLQRIAERLRQKGGKNVR